MSEKPFKLNKTITFLEKDADLIKDLEKLGYLKKTFNFTQYIKDLIIKDISNDKTFDEKEVLAIEKIIKDYLEKNKLTLIENTNVDEEVDEDVQDLLDMEY